MNSRRIISSAVIDYKWLVNDLRHRLISLKKQTKGVKKRGRTL